MLVPVSGGSVESDIAALGSPEDSVDLLHDGQQAPGSFEVNVHLTGGAELGHLPEGIVQVKIVREVLLFEVVRPEDQELVLDALRLLFIDPNVTGCSVQLGGVGVVYGLGRRFQCQDLLVMESTASARMQASAGSYTPPRPLPHPDWIWTVTDATAAGATGA